MTVVSRLQLDHPALGAAGGSGLHASIESIYTKIGNNMSSRILVALNLNNSATATVSHDFKVAFADLRWELYLYDESTTALTRITALSSPARSDFVIAATSGNPTTQIDITNNSGAQRDLALVVELDPILLAEDDVKDVLITSPTNGQVLTYETASSKWKNQNAAASKNFTKFVGAAETYTSVAAVIASLVTGDSVLVRESTSEAAGDLNVNVADVQFEWSPGAVTALSGALTNGLRVTAARVRLKCMHVSVSPSGTQARGVSVEAVDAYVEGTLTKLGAQTLTDALHVTSAGTRHNLALGVLVSAGVVTTLTNFNAAGNPGSAAWGG